jgi:hypothetical protein
MTLYGNWVRIPHEKVVNYRLLFFLIPLCASLRGQEFEFGMLGPGEILLNSTFEVQFTITSRGIPAGDRGAEGWTLGVAHQGLTLIGVTTAGTTAEEVFDQGLASTEITSTNSAGPENEGFVSAVILSFSNRDASLPAQGTATVARAFYRTAPSSCSGEARLAFVDGLEGSGEKVSNSVTWEGRTHLPWLGVKAYPDCSPNQYLLSLAEPAAPLAARLGERLTFPVTVRLGQPVATASGWTLAVAHDPDRVRIRGVSIQGTGLESLLQPPGFALFELTSGPGNEGFTARAALEPPWQALPAPDRPLAVARYELLPITDPAAVGRRIASEIRFADSLDGSGGPIVNEVYPRGLLTTRSLAVEVEVLPAARLARGDANGDGQLDVSDALAVLLYLYSGLDAGSLCLEAGNSNDDTHLDLTDAVSILQHLFISQAPLPPPFPDCGVDPTFLSLSCERTACH